MTNSRPTHDRCDLAIMCTVTSTLALKATAASTLHTMDDEAYTFVMGGSLLALVPLFAFAVFMKAMRMHMADLRPGSPSTCWSRLGHWLLGDTQAAGAWSDDASGNRRAWTEGSDSMGASARSKRAFAMFQYGVATDEDTRVLGVYFEQACRSSLTYTRSTHVLTQLGSPPPPVPRAVLVQAQKPQWSSRHLACT